MIIKKIVLVTILLVCGLAVSSQTDSLCNTEGISKYSHGMVNNYNIKCDTLRYIEMLLNVYDERYEGCEYFRKTLNIKNVKNENNARSSGGMIIPSSHRTSFVILYIIENEILKNIINWKSSFPFIRNNCKGYIVKGEFCELESLDNVRYLTDETYKVSYKKDNRDLKKIFNLYKKWVKKAKKIGLIEMRKQNIKPLDGSKYQWVSK